MKYIKLALHPVMSIIDNNHIPTLDIEPIYYFISSIIVSAAIAPKDIAESKP